MKTRWTKLVYISNAAVELDNGRVKSNLASFRYRFGAFIPFLAKFGFSVRLITLRETQSLSIPSIVESGDIFIIGKVFNPTIVELLKAVELVGKVSVVDICDNYFSHLNKSDAYSSFYKAICAKASQITVSTEFLKEVVINETGISPSVICDPVELLRRDPRIPFDVAKLKLGWFGHDANINVFTTAVVSQLNDLTSLCNIELSFFSGTQASEKVERIQEKIGSSRLKVSFKVWEEGELQGFIDDQDIILIPGLDSPYFNSKSSNRLCEALWAGKPIATNFIIPSYLPFKYALSFNSDIGQAVRFICLNQESVRKGILRAQEAIIKNYFPMGVVHEWLSILLKVCKTIHPIEPRLNLGCGDKIIPNYINIDLIPRNPLKLPDVISSIDKLPFIPSNTIKEILAIHVVEHFWYWNVKEILSEWYRVLRDDGCLVLECPNLLSASELIVRGKGSSRENRDQFTMWPLYGDPSWEDPFMCHRWAYTPQSLIQLLRDVGFRSAQLEKAEFKMKEPRDMRVVGYK